MPPKDKILRVSILSRLAHKLKGKIPSKEYKKVSSYFYSRSLQIEGEEKEIYVKKHENALEIAKKLTTTKFKNDLMFRFWFLL